MNLPKINSIRSKKYKVNGKEFTLSPWLNSTLVNFESILEDETTDKATQELIREYLIEPFVETKHNYTLIEERLLLLELYKLSKSISLDIKYHCTHCDIKSSYVVNLEKAYNYTPLKSRIIKTKDFTFNLREASNYRLDLNSDSSREFIKYLASFLNNFIYKDKEYEIEDLDKTTDWIDNELDADNFEELLNEFNKVQPKINLEVTVKCEHCLKEQQLEFMGIEHFLA